MFFGSSKGHGQFKLDLSQYLDGLYGYALALCRHQAEAEDLVQETCVRAIQAMKRLRPDSNVKSWLFTILRNIWLNQLRQRRSAPEVLELDPDRVVPDGTANAARDPHANYVRSIEREQVRSAIQLLPAEFREVIILREFEELAYQEIAKVLDCPIGTVMSRLARARLRLREVLLAASAAPRADQKDTGGAAENAS